MICSSMSWPNMFDVARSKVNVYTDMKSITNRVKLLLLTEPTELYMNPNFGVGLKKYMFTYNNDNVIPMIKDDLVAQLRLWEPRVIPEKTKVVRGLRTKNFEESAVVSERMNNLNLTVTLTTIYGNEVSLEVTENDMSRLI